MLRSILSVLAGVVTLTVTSFAIEAALNALLPGALSTSKTLMLSYGMVCVAFGGYVTAWVAPKRPLLHSGVLAILQAGLTVVAMLSPESGRASQTHWILTAILTIPAAMLGGILHARGVGPGRATNC